MNVLATRLQDCSYLVTTAFVYALMAFLFFVAPFGITQVYPISLVLDINGYVWGTMFLMSSVLSILGAILRDSVWQKVALAVAAALAGGMCIVFAWQVYLGQIVAIVPTIVWGYIAVLHTILVQYHDPHVISVIEGDIASIRADLKNLRDGK